MAESRYLDFRWHVRHHPSNKVSFRDQETYRKVPPLVVEEWVAPAILILKKALQATVQVLQLGL